MKNPYIYLIALISTTMLLNCTTPNTLEIDVYQTSASGQKLTRIETFNDGVTTAKLVITPEVEFQKITGFGGSFTEASASLLKRMSLENQNKIIEAYFGESGAKYSLTRTHINSCDFSLGNYSYAPVKDDLNLENFSIDEDRDDIIPMIKHAQSVSVDGFKIISSPWTAPPWMKDNNDWRGGKLLPQYYETWALFLSKYVSAYKAEGIDIWGITVENEPLGNDSNWESMHFTAVEMNDLVKNHIGPLFLTNKQEVKILGYDQNRDEELYHWVDTMYGDSEAEKFYNGTAIHWYASTYDYFPDALQYAKKAAPDKHLIQTEACIDAEVPHWKDDAWYWSKEATDWGWDWAPDEKKHLHPKYVPVFRYARDMIGTLNNQVDGWVDWNMILDRQGGPNWAKNWCIAPVIVDPEADEVYFTPLYYTISHFSKFIRPGAVRIGFNLNDTTIMATAAKNPDGTIAIIVFNPTDKAKTIELSLSDRSTEFSIDGRALQTIVLK